MLQTRRIAWYYPIPSKYYGLFGDIIKDKISILDLSLYLLVFLFIFIKKYINLIVQIFSRIYYLFFWNFPLLVIFL